MPISLLRHVIEQFVKCKGSLVVDNFHHIWTGHYNEILLYRHFAVFLDILREFGLCTTILSNGLNFNGVNVGQIVDAVSDGTIVGIYLNIPAGDPTSYQRYAGRTPRDFERMVSGTTELLGKLPQSFLDSRSVSIVVNGVDDDHPDQRGFLGFNAPYIPVSDLENQEAAVKKLFPAAGVHKCGGMVDRGGHLTKFGVLNHTSLYARMDEMVVGCATDGASGGRPFGWAHINSLGELFLCCSDYSFEYTFGSLATNILEELWLSKDHVKMIMRAHDGMCRTCACALKKKKIHE
jgi:hypothetical protein